MLNLGLDGSDNDARFELTNTRMTPRCSGYCQEPITMPAISVNVTLLVSPKLNRLFHEFANVFVITSALIIKGSVL